VTLQIVYLRKRETVRCLANIAAARVLHEASLSPAKQCRESLQEISKVLVMDARVPMLLKIICVPVFSIDCSLCLALCPYLHVLPAAPCGSAGGQEFAAKHGSLCSKALQPVCDRRWRLLEEDAENTEGCCVEKECPFPIRWYWATVDPPSG
jgi:hypothetical protein